jgi:hypothetical protein
MEPALNELKLGAVKPFGIVKPAGEKPLFLHVLKGDELTSKNIELHGLKLGREDISKDNNPDGQYISHAQLEFRIIEDKGRKLVKIMNTGKNSVLVHGIEGIHTISNMQSKEIPIEELKNHYLTIGKKEEGRDYKLAFSEKTSEELMKDYAHNIEKIRNDFKRFAGTESIGGNVSDGLAANFKLVDGRIVKFTNNPEDLSKSRGTVIVHDVFKNPKIEISGEKLDAIHKLNLLRVFKKEVESKPLFNIS